MLLRFHGSMTSRSCFSKAWAKQPLGGQCSPSRGPAPSSEQWGTWRPAAGCPPSQKGLSSHSAVFLAPCPVLFLLASPPAPPTLVLSRAPDPEPPGHRHCRFISAKSELLPALCQVPISAQGPGGSPGSPWTHHPPCLHPVLCILSPNKPPLT